MGLPSWHCLTGGSLELEQKHLQEALTRKTPRRLKTGLNSGNVGIIAGFGRENGDVHECDEEAVEK